jgi:ABC-type nickel/cobalt efflux system permease component RcnA
VYVRACAAASLGATTLFVIVSIMLLVRSTGFAVQLAASMLNALGFVLLCVACYLDAVRARSSEAPMDLEALQRQHSADPFKRSPIRTVASASTLRSRTASPRSSGAESAGISRIDRVAYLLHGTAAKQHRPLSESPPPQGPPESPTTQRTGLYAASLAGDKRLAPELVLPPLRRAVSTPLRGSLYEKPKTDTSPYSFLDVKTADFGRTRTSSKNSNVSAGAVSLLRLRRSIAQLGTVFRSHAAMPSSPTECHAAIDEAHSAAYSSQSLLRSVDTCSSTAHRQNSTRSASTAASWERFSWREDSMSCKRDSCMPWADAAERMMELPVRAVSASDEHGHQAWRLSAISDATFPARIGGALELDVGDISDVETPVRQDESAPAGYFSGRSPLESTSVAAATQPQTDRSSSQRWRSERRPSTPLALDVFNSNPRSPKSHTRSASLGHLDDLALSMSDAVFAVEPLAIPSTAMTRSRDAVSSWSEAMPHHPLRIPPSPRRKPVPAYLDLPLRSLSPPWMLPGQNADRPHFAAPIASAPPTGSSIMQQRQHLPALVAPSPTRPHAHKLVVEHDGSAAEPEQQPSRLASPRRTTCLSRSSCEEDAHAYCTAALLFGGRKPSGLASS